MAVNQLPAVTTPTNVQPARDVRSAQRAFFQTALAQTQAAPATQAVAPVARPQVSGSARAAAPDAADGRKLLPPGSLLDIRI